MNKRQLGKTNINLTAIGFGGAPLGNLFESLDERSCYNILEKTYEAGINIYDTSPLYGYGLSEHRLGNFLKTVDEESYFLSTKVGRYLTPAKKENIDRGRFAGSLNFSPNLDYSYDGVMRSFEQSLLRLAVSKVDICLIHDVDRFNFGDEVDHYFKLAMDGAYKAVQKLKEEKVKLNFIGDISRFSKKLINQIERSKKQTRDYRPDLNLIIAASYGGKWDIINAVTEFLKENKKDAQKKKITEASVQKHLQTNNFPDPDLIIRSGGEKRLSNFYLWQSSYSELYFSNKYWPDFNKNDLDKALDDYFNRKRKYGVETG
mgnify:CR=1 FL=1